eukprot:2096342-Heterocapsa_arctica.AAC.1
MALCHETGTAEDDLFSRRLDEPVKLLAKGLYILLNDRISGGKAKDIMEAFPMNEGFVAWRRLSTEYEKEDSSRFTAMLNGLLNPNLEHAMKTTGRNFKDLQREWENAVE